LADIELKNRYTPGKAYGISTPYVIWVMRHFVSEMEKAGVNNSTFNEQRGLNFKQGRDTTALSVVRPALVSRYAG
jgi:hypothetical protein